MSSVAWIEVHEFVGLWDIGQTGPIQTNQPIMANAPMVAAKVVLTQLRHAEHHGNLENPFHGWVAISRYIAGGRNVIVNDSSFIDENVTEIEVEIEGRGCEVSGYLEIWYMSK